MDDLLEALSSLSLDERARAADALVALGERAVAPLRAFAPGYSDVARAALLVLGRIAAEGCEAAAAASLPGLIDVLQRPDTSREDLDEVTLLLFRIPGAAGALLAEVVKQKEPGHLARVTARLEDGRRGLVGLALEGPPGHRARAVRCLQYVGESALEALEHALGSPERAVVRAAVETLGAMSPGAVARRSGPGPAPLSEAGYARAARLLARELGGSAGDHFLDFQDHALPALEDALLTGPARAQQEAARALGRWAKAPGHAERADIVSALLPRLEARLEREAEAVLKTEVAKAFVHLGGDDGMAIQALVRGGATSGLEQMPGWQRLSRDRNAWKTLLGTRAAPAEDYLVQLDEAGWFTGLPDTLRQRIESAIVTDLLAGRALASGLAVARIRESFELDRTVEKLAEGSDGLLEAKKVPWGDQGLRPGEPPRERRPSGLRVYFVTGAHEALVADLPSMTRSVDEVLAIGNQALEWQGASVRFQRLPDDGHLLPIALTSPEAFAAAERAGLLDT